MPRDRCTAVFAWILAPLAACGSGVLYRVPGDAAPDVGSVDAGPPRPDAAVDAAADARPDTVVPPTDAATDAGLGPWSPSLDCATTVPPLLAGVQHIVLGGLVSSPLVVHGAGACPVAVDEHGTTFAAIGTLGTGRMAEVGHEGLVYDTQATDDRGALARNLVGWLAQGRAGVTVAFEAQAPQLRAALVSAGYTVRNADLSALGGIGVVVLDAGRDRTDTQRRAILDFVRAGGGALVAGHAWYWSYSHSDPARNFPGNLLVDPAGITITGDTDVSLPASAAALQIPSPLDHAGTALEALRLHVARVRTLGTAELARASASLRRALRVLPIDHPWLQRARTVRLGLPDVIPSPAHPVRPASMPVEAFTVLLDTRLALELPPSEVRTHPAASTFPFDVPGATVEPSVTLSIDGAYEGRTQRVGGNGFAPVWRSTGLWVPPGRVVTVSLPDSLVGQGVDLQIGAHTDDNLDLADWQRMPRLVRRVPIDDGTVEIASGFGGLLYVRVAPGTSLPRFSMEVRGAVRAPRFVRGATTYDTWTTTVRAFPAPWAELEGRNVVLTVPSSVVRSLDDPAPLLDLWDRILDADADLSTLPRVRPRAERIVFDTQIVAGYMHAGYPIMAPIEPAAREAVDFDTLRLSGNWGFFHELGHNHQFVDWGWNGTGEATVNLYSVYVMEQVSRVPRASAHSELRSSARAARIQTYIANGRNFSRDWSVWTALETFLQLQEGFGWNLFTTLDAEYLALPDAQRPADENARIQRWIVRSSQVSGRNLVPFYTAWGFPISTETQTAVSGLPDWTGNPMR